MKNNLKYMPILLICVVLAVFMVMHTRVDIGEVQNDRKQEEVQTAESIVYPTYYEEEISETLRFQAQVIVADSFQGNIFYRTEAGYQECDLSAVLGLHEEFVNGEDTEIVEYDMEDRSGNDSRGYFYFSTQNKMCIYPDLYTFSRTKEEEYYYYAFGHSRVSQDMYNADAYSKVQELDFASKEEALEIVLEHLEAIGYFLEDYSFQGYALDYETMNRETQLLENKIDGYEPGELNLKLDWEKEDEAYAFYIWQTCQGLPVFSTVLNSFSYLEEDTAAIQAIVGKDGIISIRVTDVLDISTGTECSDLLPFESIVGRIAEKYDGIITQDTIIVTQMQLCALTSRDGKGGCSLIPVWLCSYQNQDENLGQMIIDAVTGYEIYAN